MISQMMNKLKVDNLDIEFEREKDAESFAEFNAKRADISSVASASNTPRIAEVS